MDRLTQLQDALDQLATQFYSAIGFIDAHHGNEPIEGQVPMDSENGNIDMEAVQKELAADLVVKFKQIDLLIQRLPGLGVSETEQIERMSQLNKEIKAASEEQNEAVKRQNTLKSRIDNLILDLANEMGD
ncbi:hypothetical protein CANCADRAFT_53311 [Tortispora caseinolytica NRRL Y-17796]|uniref:Mediator of RNA polymerase II transcription subunit 21 n=1 Tax=Tortispora caseinolytica NRRL Y-17796 TaxID=767744 RepID=A0A1E4TB89_9ASCO|nr:hypothetical protein CANCADRAFT_53311 [Tortispora caseinolytica NRRL Y-17796]